MPEPRFLTGPTINYAANAKESEKLDRGFILREMALRLSIGLTADAGDAIDAANCSPAGIWGIVKAIRLKLNSNTIIRDISGDELKMLNYFYYNQGDYDEESNLAIGVGLTDTVTSTLILPLWMVDSIQPIDTQLDARVLSGLQIEVDWGNITDITSAASASISTDPTIEVGTLNAWGIRGPFNTQIVTSEIRDTVGVNTKYQIDLATGNLYRSLLIGVQDSSGYDVAGSINNIRLKSGGTDFFNLPADMFNAWQDKREKLFTRTDAGDLWFSDNRDVKAWYYLDFVTDGHLSETINTAGMSELKLELDVGVAIDTLIIVKQEIVPLAK